MNLTPHPLPGATRTAIGITGNINAVDPRTLEVLPGVLELLRDLNRERRLTMILVTHDQNIAQQADRVVRLTEGRVEEWSTVLA